MRKLSMLSILGTVLTFALFTSILYPKSTHALSGTDFRAGNIIGDSIFFNNTSMSVDQIQAFLNAKVPICDTWGTQTHSSGQTRAQYGASRGNPAPYTCLKDYRQDTPSRVAENGLCDIYSGGNKSSAQIIYDVAQACGINPQVLLVLLQKEQSLVTDDWPWNIQYRSATGFGCPDTAPCDSEYYGFFNQVYNAGRIYKKYARDAANYNYRAGRNNNILFNPNVACGSSSVYIENQATAGLYVYTPYQPNAAALNNLYGTGDSCSAYGNRNFWRMFNDWFGSTQSSFLVRTPGNPTYYLLTGGKKFAIPSGDILYAYGIETARVDVISNMYLNSLTDGGMLGTLFTVPGDNTVFMADLGKKYGIASGEYCVRWGLACGNTNAQKEIGREIFDRMPNGGILQAVMFHNGSYYLMENGEKRHFISLKSYIDRGYSHSNSTPIGNWTNAIRPMGYSLPENNSFIKFASGDAIYLYANGSFLTIPDYSTFVNWYSGGRIASYLDSSSKYNVQLPSMSGSISSLIELGGDKYLVDSGRRIKLTAVTSNWPAGTDATPYSSAANLLPITVTANNINTYRLSNGAIYKVVNQQKRPFNSVYDFFALDSGPAIQLSASTLSIPEGPVLLGEGSAYKITGSDAIFFIGNGKKSYVFTSIKQIYDFKTNLAIPTITPTAASEYSYQGVLSYRVTDSKGNVFVINNGSKHQVSSVMAANWGFSTSSNIVLADSKLNNIPTGNAVGMFIGSSNGTIYTYGNGAKKPISTFEKYKSLGGNNNNTIGLSEQLLNELPTDPVTL